MHKSATRQSTNEPIPFLEEYILIQHTSFGFIIHTIISNATRKTTGTKPSPVREGAGSAPNRFAMIKGVLLKLKDSIIVFRLTDFYLQFFVRIFPPQILSGHFFVGPF